MFDVVPIAGMQAKIILNRLYAFMPCHHIQMLSMAMIIIVMVITV